LGLVVSVEVGHGLASLGHLLPKHPLAIASHSEPASALKPTQVQTVENSRWWKDEPNRVSVLDFPVIWRRLSAIFWLIKFSERMKEGARESRNDVPVRIAWLSTMPRAREEGATKKRKRRPQPARVAKGNHYFFWGGSVSAWTREPRAGERREGLVACVCGVPFVKGSMGMVSAQPSRGLAALSLMVASAHDSFNVVGTSPPKSFMFLTPWKMTADSPMKVATAGIISLTPLIDAIAQTSRSSAFGRRLIAFWMMPFLVSSQNPKRKSG